MGFWFTSMFLGNLMAGWLGSLWSSLSSVYFFLLMGALGVLGALIVVAARRPLSDLMSLGQAREALRDGRKIS
jgi:POT family proton-dependent oligopeptide transporter